MKRSPTTPSLFAPKLKETVAYYVEVLGFEQSGSYKVRDGTETWAEVTHGESRIWLFNNSLDRQPGPAFSGLIYIFVNDVDAVATRLRGNVHFEWGPETQAYGLRELGIRDVNGYYIVFAKDE